MRSRPFRLVLGLIAAAAAAAGPAAAQEAGLAPAVREAPAVAPGGGPTGHVEIAVFPGVDDTEFTASYEVFARGAALLGEDRIKVITVASTKAPVRTHAGLALHPNHTVETAPAPDVIIVPGGEGFEKALEDAPLIRWLTRAAPSTRIVVSHQEGTFLVAKAGLLNNVRVAIHPRDASRFAVLFPKTPYIQEFRFIHDEKFVTSTGGVGSYDAALWAFRQVHLESLARRVARSLGIEDWKQENVPHLPDVIKHPEFSQILRCGDEFDQASAEEVE